jgi:hypothetical protein
LLRDKDASFRLPILNGKNYLIWAESWEMYFDEMELWEVVKIPHGQELNPAQVKKNRRAYLMILTSVNSSIQPFVKYGSEKSASKAWKILKDKYQGTSAAHVDLLEAKLDGLKYNIDKGICELFSEGQSIMNELHALGEMIRETKVVLKIIKALPESFATEKAIIKTIENISMARAEELLIQAEADLKKTHEGETAMAAHVTKNFKPRLRCWECGKRGHKRPQCPKLKSGDRDDEQGRARGGTEMAGVAVAQSAPRAREVYEVPF